MLKKVGLEALAENTALQVHALSQLSKLGQQSSILGLPIGSTDGCAESFNLTKSFSEVPLTTFDNSKEISVDVAVTLPVAHDGVFNVLIVLMRQLSVKERALKVCQKNLSRSAYSAIHPPPANNLCKLWPFPLLPPREEIPTFEARVIELLVASGSSAGADSKARREHIQGDGDIELVDTTVSFLCPLTLRRMHIPGRGRRCLHLQCFDLEAFLEFNNRAKAEWKCIVCAKRLSCKELVADSRMLYLLRKYEKLEKCVIKPNGIDCASSNDFDTANSRISSAVDSDQSDYEIE
ncbi:hypothetical protein HDU84_002486 [Entophlyctis sp. JEL0112]|nr:hypothetical protein HDU84_002486 [Entophlyctis sp. JEL0112]